MSLNINTPCRFCFPLDNIFQFDLNNNLPCFWRSTRHLKPGRKKNKEFTPFSKKSLTVSRRYSFLPCLGSQTCLSLPNISNNRIINHILAIYHRIRPSFLFVNIGVCSNTIWNSLGEKINSLQYCVVLSVPPSHAL